MGSHISVGSITTPSGSERTLSNNETTKVEANESSKRALDSATTIASIQTIKELQQAELQGLPLSISDEQLIKAIDRAFKAIQGKMTTFEYSFHQATKQITVKVKDKDTGEIIREIPPEKTLDLLAKMWEMAGIFVDERR